MRLREKVAIVTGGASGIGRAIALALGTEGARVAVLDLDQAGAVAAAAAIVTAKRDAHPWQVDVADPARVDAVVAEVVARWDTVHVLVNCAGWDRPIPFVETTPDFWDKILAINLKGPIACTRAVLPAMIAQGYGKIVSIASDAGRVGSTGEAVYSATKAGIIGFTKTLAREVAKHGVTANVVCPGPTDTPLLSEMIGAGNDRLITSLQRAIPLGRLGRPEEVAAAVAFLASDDAAFITGQTLSVSGGLTMS